MCGNPRKVCLRIGFERESKHHDYRIGGKVKVPAAGIEVADIQAQFKRFSSLMSAIGASESEIKQWWDATIAETRESQNNGKQVRPLPKTDGVFWSGSDGRQHFLLRCITWKIGGRDRLIEAVGERFGGYSRATYYRDLKAIDECPLVPWTDEQLALLQKGGVDEVIRVHGQAGLEGLQASVDAWYSMRAKRNSKEVKSDGNE